MKRFTIICALVLGIVLAAGFLSCTPPMAKPVTFASNRTGICDTCLTKTRGTCCDSTSITVVYNQWPALNQSATVQNLTNHSMLLIASVDSCPCGPDTTFSRVVGPDSMRVTKAGAWLSAYFSATVPLAPETLSVGSHYYVVFQKN